MMVDRPWQGLDGLPTRHALRAAVQVAALLDVPETSKHDAQETYWHATLGGTFQPDDLRIGETLLEDLMLIQREGARIVRLPAVDHLLGLGVDDAMAALAVRWIDRLPADIVVSSPGSLVTLLEQVGEDGVQARQLVARTIAKFDDTLRKEVGAAGEEIVVRQLRDELLRLGRHDLARQVRRVSLESDAFGFDVAAPRLDGAPRHLEVKATTQRASDFVEFFISRHEVETARVDRHWALVFCVVDNVATVEGEVLAWTTADPVLTAVPCDTDRGRWESARLRLRRNIMSPGMPSPF